MSTASRPNKFLAAAAALAVVPAASALLANRSLHSSHARRFGRPSSVPLDASQQSFSELDRLRAKRLSIRRPRGDAEVEAAADARDADDVADDITDDGATAGLEYLYEAGEERHSDDLFHLILMPSTFKKDHMSIENTAESCTAVLGIPSDKAQDLSLFAKHQGFSCLGTWTRDECLAKGEELRSEDLDCRVIPFNGGIPSSSLLEGGVPGANEPEISFDNPHLISL